jgi:hypothetical protein
MRLIVVYCIVVVIGELAVFPPGLLIERTIPQFSMLLYMVMFLGVLWGGWPLAVSLTERFLPSTREAGEARKPAKP